jgi:hypothetical protein
MTRVAQEAQCNLSLAKAWVIHQVPSHLNEHPALSALRYAVTYNQVEAVSILQ